MNNEKNLSSLKFINNRTGTNSYKWDKNENIKYSFGIADMDIALSDNIIKAINKKIDTGLFGYEYISENYYDTFINWVRNRHNIEIKKDWIIVVDGVITGIKIAVQSFTKEGDGVLILNPYYHSYVDAIKNNNRRLVTSNLIYKNNNYELNTKNFEKIILRENVKLFILNNPHNPTGKVWSEKELREIYKICSKHSVLIISDEVFGDFVVPRNSFVSFSSVCDSNGLLIIATSPCKTFNISGLKISNFIIKNYSIRREFINQKNKNMSERANCLSLAISEMVYKHGEFWLNSVITNSLINKKVVMDFLKEKYPDIQIVNSSVVYWTWINLNALSIPEDALHNLFLKHSIEVSYGSIFGNLGDGFIRVNLMCSVDNIKVFLRTFDEILKSYRKLRGNINDN